MFKMFQKSLASQELSFKELFAYGCGMFAIGVGGLGSATYITYFWFFGIVSVITGVMLFLSFAGTKEKVTETNQQAGKLSLKDALKIFAKNRWWIIATIYQFFAFVMLTFMAVNMYYMIYIMRNDNLMSSYMSLQSTVMFFVPFALTLLVSKMKGKINVSLVGIIFTVIGGILPLFNSASVALLMVSSVLRGIGIAFMFCVRFAIMADVTDYGEYISGRRMDGMVYSGISMSGKLGMGIAGALLTFLLGISGYAGGADAQPASALSMIKFMFTWLMVIIALLMGICLFYLKGLEKDMPEISAELRKRKLTN
jgi:GPH family glycoside/pentoside/hexuronide:cation symporter